MSIHHVQWLFENGPKKGSDLLVLIAIAEFADADGMAWPSLQTIAERSRLGERAARYALRRLEAEGWLQTDRKAGRKGCNRYYISTRQPAIGAGSDDQPADIAGGQPADGAGSDLQPADIADCQPADIAGDDAQPAKSDTSTGTTVPPNHQGTTNRAAKPREDREVIRERILTEGLGLEPEGIAGPNGRVLGTTADMARVDAWIALGLTVSEIIATIAERRRTALRGGLPSCFKYFDGAMSDLAAAKLAPAAKPKPKPSRRADGGETREEQIARWKRMAKA